MGWGVKIQGFQGCGIQGCTLKSFCQGGIPAGGIRGIPKRAGLIQGKVMGGKAESGMQHRHTWRGSRDANPSFFPPTSPKSDTCRT